MATAIFVGLLMVAEALESALEPSEFLGWVLMGIIVYDVVTMLKDK